MAGDHSTGQPPAFLLSKPVTAQGGRRPKAARKRLKAPISAEIGRLHKTHAVLIAIQFAANHEAEFDVSDAIAVIIERIEQTIATLDLLALEARDE